MKKKNALFLLIPALLLGGNLISCGNQQQQVIKDEIKLNKTTLDLLFGETFKLEVTFTTTLQTKLDVTFSSSDESVATVSETGLVTALNKVGKATITATNKENNLQATCTVNVSKPKVVVNSLTLDKANATLGFNETLLLNATVLPEDAEDKTLTWTSSDPAVATVSETGLVTALNKVGETTIKVESKNKKFATCVITVIDKTIHVESVKLDKTNEKLAFNTTLQLNATVLPENAENKEVRFESSDPTVATVSETGLVTALNKVGETIIKVVTLDNNKEATCKIEVFDPITHALNITLDKEVVLLNKNESNTLKATLTPSDVSDNTLVFELLEGSSEYIDVNQEGVITSKDKFSGTKEIGVKVFSKQDPTVQAVCKVIVGNIEISEPEKEYKVNGTEYSLQVSLNTSMNSTVKVTSSNLEVVKTAKFERGKLLFTPLKEGKTTLEVTTEDGFKDSVEINCTKIEELPAGLLNTFFRFEDEAEGGDNILSSGGLYSNVDFKVEIKNNTLTFDLDHGKAVLSYTYNGNKDGEFYLFENGNYQIKVALSGENLKIAGTEGPVSDPLANLDDKTLFIQQVITIKKYIAPTSIKLGFDFDSNPYLIDGNYKFIEGSTHYLEFKDLLPLNSSARIGRIEVISATEGYDVSGDPTFVELTSFGNGITFNKIDTYEVVAYDVLDENVFASVEVEVVAKPTLTLSSKTLELDLQSSQQTTLKATISNNNPFKETFTFKSSDSRIVKVDNNGNLVALKVGEATITVTSSLTNLTATCKVTVKDSSKPTLELPAGLEGYEANMMDTDGYYYFYILFGSNGTTVNEIINSSFQDETFTLTKVEGNVFTFTDDYNPSITLILTYDLDSDMIVEAYFEGMPDLEGVIIYEG